MDYKDFLKNFLLLARLNLYGLTKMHAQGYTGKTVKGGIIDCFNREHGYNVESNAIGKPINGQMFGTSPDLNCKRYSMPNKFDETDIVRALKECIVDEVDIINMSFGTPTNYIVVERQIQECARLGIIMIAAIGNEGEEYADHVDIKLYPASYPEVIAVGSVDNQLNWSEFENHGTSIDLVGIGELSVIQMKDGSYQLGTGTSTATPQIFGMFACVLDMFRQKGFIATAEHVKEYIFKRCVDLGKLGRDNFYGRGFPTMDIDEWHEMYLELNGITEGVKSQRLNEIIALQRSGVEDAEAIVNKRYNIIDYQELVAFDGTVKKIPFFNLKAGVNG